MTETPAMREPVRIPKDLFARLMAAIETPDDLTDEDRRCLLEDADQHYPYDENDQGPEGASA